MGMKKYNVQYSTSFNKELVEIVTYLTHTLNRPKIAKKLIHELEQRIEVLRLFPQIFSPQMHNGKSIYKFKIQNYLVFYYIQKSTITICNIIYSKRNLPDLLNSIK